MPHFECLLVGPVLRPLAIGLAREFPTSLNEAFYEKKQGRGHGDCYEHELSQQKGRYVEY